MLLPVVLIVYAVEIVVDWLKHAFVTRFNEIPVDVYREYTLSLAYDLAATKSNNVASCGTFLPFRFVWGRSRTSLIGCVGFFGPLGPGGAADGLPAAATGHSGHPHRGRGRRHVGPGGVGAAGAGLPGAGDAAHPPQHRLVRQGL